MNYLSLAGVLGLIGEADSKPVIPLNLVADYAGASLHGALGIVLALFARERTGPRPARGHLVPRHHAVAARGHAEHALLLQRRRGAEPGRGLPGRLLSLLRDLRDARQQAPDDRLHRAVAVGELLQGHRAARTSRASPASPTSSCARPTPKRRRRATRSRRVIRTRDRDEWYEFLVKADVCVGKVYDDRGDGAAIRRSLIAA